MSNKGFIKVDRSLMDNWIWREKPFSKGQAWIDLIMMANHKDTKCARKGKIIVFKRGEVNRSLSSLAQKWGWDRRTVSRFLAVLESDGMVSVDSTTHGTTITVENYNKYQTRRTTDGTTHGTTRAQHDVQHAPTNKNDKEYIKNDKEPPYNPPVGGRGRSSKKKPRNEVLEMIKEGVFDE